MVPERLWGEYLRRVEVFVRGTDGAWEHRVFAAGDIVVLPSVGVAFPTDAIYDAAGLALR